MKPHRKDWHSVTLPEISVVFTDGPFGSNLKSAHYVDQGIRVIRLQNIGVGRMLDNDLAFISRQHYESFPRNHCKPGDLVIGTLGDPNLRACIIPPHVPEALNKADCLLLRLDESRADRNYVCAVLNSDLTVKRANGLVRGQTRGRISMGRLKGLTIPLPPLPEQKRIAGILDAADALRAKRRESLAQLDTLLQSTFLDMFGDPVTNPMGWDLRTLDNLGEVRTGSTPPSTLDGMFDGDIPFVTPGDLKESWVASSRTVTEAGAEKSRTVRKGATLVCCIGATIGKMGKAASLSAFNQQINAVSWGEQVADDYGLEMMRFFKTKIAKDGASTTLPILKKSLFQKMQVPVPPRDLQNRFATIVESVEAQKARLRAHLAELDTIFSSLQSRAFNGEL